MTQPKIGRGIVAAIVLGCFFVGAVAGALGSLFLAPYLLTTDWGRDFLRVEPRAVATDSGEDAVEPSVAAVAQASPSVVSIIVTKEINNVYNLTGPSLFDFWGFEMIPNFEVRPRENSSEPEKPIKQEIGGGSGFIISAEGLVLTNRHVVDEEDAEYTVVLNSGEKYPAEVLARDAVNDIAILKIIDAQALPVAALGDSDALAIGQTVVAIGNALSEYRNTVTRGVVSGVNRRLTAGDGLGRQSAILEGAIQTDAAINPGNSGGPLVNLRGEVIGINTAINLEGRAIGFAIPINQAKSVIESVLAHGRIVRPWLGVRYLAVDEALAEKNGLTEIYGAWVVGDDEAGEPAVVPDSPAAKAGLRAEDLILTVNGVKLDQTTSLVTEIVKYAVGETVVLTVSRNGEILSLPVVLAERQEQP